MSFSPNYSGDLAFAHLHRHLLLTSDGRFNLVRKLGKGGAGAVYLAKDEVTRNLVAAKFPTGLDGYERFERAEIVAVKTLSRYRGMPTYVADRIGIQPPWLIMDYVKGKTLREVLRGKGPLSLTATVEVARSLLQPLAYAHTEGIAHRDIKPSNLMITEEGRCALRDFGTAAVGGVHLTDVNGIVGTTAYLAPSRIAGDVDRKSVFNSDLYSVGVVLYECINGHLPPGHDFANKYPVARMIHQFNYGIHTQVDSLATPFEREFIGSLVDPEKQIHIVDALRDLDELARKLGITTPEHSSYRAHHRRNEILAALAKGDEQELEASAQRVRSTNASDLTPSTASPTASGDDLVMASASSGTTLVIEQESITPTERVRSAGSGQTL